MCCTGQWAPVSCSGTERRTERRSAAHCTCYRGHELNGDPPRPRPAAMGCSSSVPEPAWRGVFEFAVVAPDDLFDKLAASVRRLYADGSPAPRSAADAGYAAELGDLVGESDVAFTLQETDYVMTRYESGGAFREAVAARAAAVPAQEAAYAAAVAKAKAAGSVAPMPRYQLRVGALISIIPLEGGGTPEETDAATKRFADDTQAAYDCHAVKILFLDRVGMRDGHDDDDYDALVESRRSALEEANPAPYEMQIYTHITHVDDVNNVEKVMNDVNHIVINFSLAKGGLI